MKIKDLFEGKGTKEQAGYIPRPKNGEKCINCTMWRDPNKCTAVAGNISPNGWCEWYAGGAYGKRGKRVTESLSELSQWKNEEPVSYVKHLAKFFKNPDELTHKRAIWYNKDGFKRIEVLDEYILHSSPVPHYDYVYSYVDIKVPHDLSDDLAKSSESILIDHLKGEVGARCASLSANAVTIQYVLDVVEKNIQPSKVEYEKRIKSMKKMFSDGKRFELEWWPDVTGDTDPKNPYYKESKLNHNQPIKEDGRIVKGVNTTVDVGPNEIKRQAAKFGNTVDKDGRPPTLSKKVKGKSTNVLYNLGLTEAVNPELLDKNFYKEKIIDTKAGKIKLVAQHYPSNMIPQIKVEAFVDDKLVGNVRFVIAGNDEPVGFLKKFKKADPYLVAGNLRVENEYQRKGIATAMYQFVKSMGNDIKPSSSQTDQGKAFWTSKPNESSLPRYTAAEWAIIEGGHSLENSEVKTKLFDFDKY